MIEGTPNKLAKKKGGVGEVSVGVKGRKTKESEDGVGESYRCEGELKGGRWEGGWEESEEGEGWGGEIRERGGGRRVAGGRDER